MSVMGRRRAECYPMADRVQRLQTALVEKIGRAARGDYAR
jgi:hypothetical protein